MIQFLRNKVHNQFNAFSKTSLYQTLKKIPGLPHIKTKTITLIGKCFPHSPPFYGDPIFQKAFLLLARRYKVSSVVETGTFMGKTTEFLAQELNQVPIYTSEINKSNFEKARKILVPHKNVHQFLGTSPLFIKGLMKKGSMGRLPLFFLDAHWLDEWPLEEEIELITKHCKKAIITIHDFKIPGQPQFKFDAYGNKVCSIEMIKPKMSKKNTYSLLLPKYTKKQLGANNYYLDIVGYPLIFQNMAQEFAILKKDPFIQNYFTDGSHLLQ